MRNEEKNIKRCAIYTRKSVEDGLEQEFNSLDAQREAGENYIASQKSNGWICVKEQYDDGGWSGGNIERPALKRLLDDVKAKKIDIIVVYKIDRLSRSLVDFAELQTIFDEYNVAFCAVTQEINTSTSAGRMMLNILMTFAQYEREIIAERVRDKIAASKKRGKNCGGSPILGYETDSDTKKLKIVKKEAVIVKAIYEKYHDTRSLMATAQAMNELGYTTKHWFSAKGVEHKGQPWITATIYRTLTNSTYAGYVKHYDKLYDGEHEAIIKRDFWLKIQAMMKENTTGTRREKQNAVHTPLRGLLKCAHCGGALTPTYGKSKGRKYTYFICQKSMKDANTNCPLPRIPAGDIEDAVLHQLSALLTTPTLIRETLSAVLSSEKVMKRKLQNEKDELNKHIKMLRESALDGDVNVTELKNAGFRNREITAQLKKLEVQTTEDDIIKSLSDVGAMRDMLFPKARYELLHLLIRKILIAPDKISMILQRDGMDELVKEMAISGYFTADHDVENPQSAIIDQRELGDGSIELSMPLLMKKIDGHRKVVIPVEGQLPLRQDTVLRAIRKAQEWSELILQGTVPNVAQLAKSVGKQRPYVERILSLTSLAPDIIEAIFRGDTPETLSLERLFKGIPDDWKDQRKALGFI